MNLYDAVDEGLIARLRSRIPQRARNFRTDIRSHWLRHYAAAMGSTVLYYADFAKDVAIMVQFREKLLADWSLLLSSPTPLDYVRNNFYAFTVFLCMLASVVGSELSKAMLVFHHDAVRKRGLLLRRLLAAGSAPLIPALANFQLARNELEMVRACRDANHHRLSQLRAKSATLQELKASLRAIENCLEHFVQFTLLAVVLLAEDSRTKPVQSLGNILFNENRAFVVAGAGLAFLSLLRGQVGLVAASKRGHLPAIGRLILVTYFAVGLAARTAAVVLLFTPLLGLFNVLRSLQMAGLDASKETLYSYTTSKVLGLNKTRSGMPEYYYVTLNDKWKQFKMERISQLFVLHGAEIAAIYGSVLALVGGVHLIGIVYARLRLRVALSSAWHWLQTLLCPLLFYDWENYHRKGDSIAHAYTRSVRLLTALALTLAVENCILCLPLAFLRIRLDARSEAMREAFSRCCLGSPRLPRRSTVSCSAASSPSSLLCQRRR